MKKLTVTKKRLFAASEQKQGKEARQIHKTKPRPKVKEKTKNLNCTKQRKLKRLLRQNNPVPFASTSKEQHKNSTLKRAFQRQEKEAMAISNID